MQKWIGNERAGLKRKASTDSSTGDVVVPSTSKLKFPGFKRGLTSFNVFCGEFFQEGNVLFYFYFNQD